MRTEKEVLELRGEVYKTMQEIQNRAHLEKRTLTDDEIIQWERANKEFEAYTKERNIITANMAISKELDDATSDDQLFPKINNETEDERKARAEKLYWKQLLSSQPMTAKEAFKMAHAEGPTRAQTSTGGTGAYVIPETFVRELEVYMLAFGGMLRASRIFKTPRGGTMNWPSIDDTTKTGAWVEEPRSVGLTPRAFTFARKQFAAYTWADIAQITWEFDQDEDVDFLSTYLSEFFGTAAGRALNIAFTTGDGSGKPTGILDGSAGASTGKTTASASAITKEELIDVKHSVDPAYRMGPKVVWMMNDSTVAYISKLDVGTDTGLIWQPSMQAGTPDRIMGYPVVVNQQFPAIAASQKVIAFGDFSKYIIREVKGFSMVRLQERYADQLSDGFLGWMRYDAKLNNTSAIKLLTMHA